MSYAKVVMHGLGLIAKMPSKADALLSVLERLQRKEIGEWAAKKELRRITKEDV